MITASAIQKLREETGAGVMECKRALEEAKGNSERAKEIIRQKGLVRAEKKAERQTGAGLVHAYIHGDKIGVLLLIRSETDFVARSEPFRKLTHELALHIAAMNPENPEELLKQPFIRNQSQTIEELIKQEIARFGENIKIELFCRYEV